MFMTIRDNAGTDVIMNFYEIEVIYEHITHKQAIRREDNSLQEFEERDPARCKVRMKSGKEFVIPQPAAEVLRRVNIEMSAS